MKEFFRKFARTVADAMGSASIFVAAVAVVVVWAALGPHYLYSDTWQLVINTSTTIVTFLMVFLIQNSQNRDARATHLKLDELLRGVKGARTGLVQLEEMTDDQLNALQEQFKQLQLRAETRLGGGNSEERRRRANAPNPTR